MKSIWHIYRNDWKSIFMVPSVTLLVLALTVLPSIYAWINIKSMWDPYGNTSGLRIAVTNEDEGATVRGEQVNVGDTVIESLKKNKSLGWVFVDRKRAERGVRHGDYYASLLIPKDFSKKLSSILEEKPEKPEIQFAVNEKINAVTPKITGSGATSITAQVSESFVRNVGDAIFSAFQQIGIELEQELPNIEDVKQRVFQLEKALPQIEAMGNQAIALEKKLPAIRERGQKIIELEKRIPELERAGDSILKVEASLPVIEEAGKRIAALQEQLADIQQTTAVLNEIDASLASVDALVQEAIEQADGAAEGQAGNVEELKRLRDELVRVRGGIQDLRASLAENVDQAVKLINQAGTFAKQELPVIEEKIQRAADFVRNDLPKLERDIHSAADMVRTKLPEAERVIHQAADFARNDFPSFETKVRSAADRIREFDNEMDLNEMIAFLKRDPKQHSEFLAEPIELHTKRIFPIPNYGSAMTPFYTMLALWVGATILVASLRVNVEDPEGQYRNYQLYFGRLLTFLTIGLLQALIVTLGNLLLLGTYAVDKPHFVLFSMFISMIFVVITYTLCSVFGNIGKGLAIIFLVLQIASSGVTFPVSMTSPFFQAINPFMPFTYAISMLREAVGGVVWEVVAEDMMYLGIFVIVSFLLALTLKQPLSKRLQRTTERASMTKIVP